MPRPHPKKGKGVWQIWTVSLVWPARWTCADTTVVKQTLSVESDWSMIMGTRADDSKLYSRQWHCGWCAKAAISLECSNSFPWPNAGLCPNSSDPFSSSRVGSGDETSGLYVIKRKSFLK